MTDSRYSKASIVLHWGMVALIAAVYATIESRTLFERGSDIREGVKTWHFMLGLTVFVLVWLRIAARLLWPAPPIAPTPPRWQRAISAIVHGFLYILMIGMPIGGWLILSGEAKVIPFWGFELPPLMAPDKALAHKIEEVHETLGTIGYWMIGLHAVAALVHHYIWKDSVLRRMWVRA
jgi:cytochrome b561